uniref:Uncharacterized protein n=1 Tax=Oryzias latipes TaxID=8090 RepID=A0A3P9MJV5_ORYLA
LSLSSKTPSALNIYCDSANSPSSKGTQHMFINYLGPSITTKPIFKAQNKCQILFDAGGLWLLHRLQSKRKEGRKEKYKVNTVNNLAISKSHFKLGFSFPLPIS